MLRRQAANHGKLSFLSGDGEMARRIREMDWKNHPLGVPENWPASLRSALGIALNSAYPTAIYWGNELRLLYNDAWAPIPGPRHPASLGAPAKEVWPDIWDIIEPQFHKVIETGSGVSMADQFLPMTRYGVPEETYWTYNFTPIRNDDGLIVGIFNSGHETTTNILIQRKDKAILKLNDALRNCTDLELTYQTALDLIGTTIGIDRAAILDLDSGEETTSITQEWCTEGQDRLNVEQNLSDWGDWIASEMRNGHIVKLDDIHHHNDKNIHFEFLDQNGIAALLAIPKRTNGVLTSVILLSKQTPRDWNEIDISTAEELLERTEHWIERIRNAEREHIMIREIDHRARNALAVAQSVARLTRASTIEDYKQKIESRFAALGRAHKLLATEHWQRVSLKTLIEQELDIFAAENSKIATLEGPNIQLRPEFAQTTELVIHELATNASKHGALSDPSGELKISWVISEDRLNFDWVETWMTKKQSDAKGNGFGSILLDRIVSNQLQGEINQTIHETGFTCRIEFPLNPQAERRDRETRQAPAAPDTIRILIAEDEAIVAMDIESMMTSMNYDIFGCFGTFEETMKAIETGTPDLALLDANLHGESSIPIAENLIARGVPVIFATGYSELTGKLAEYPDLTILTKPVDEGKLARAIETKLSAIRQ
ncbi:HWE histidine kinase domain-containing protein [Parvularcula marina]|uniref:HWE histidine kinase domain-containing protein n=1 Tax=Parvularcula marina TaxID=2292771 RepID=UPI0035188A33